MPHKHKRLKNTSQHDLPPTSLARPLPVTAPTTHKYSHRPKPRKTHDDDTPRAFTRLLHYTTTGQKPPRGLDSVPLPSSKTKKRKRQDRENPEHNNNNDNNSDKRPTNQDPPEIPKILPGERTADFSARVDQSIPVAGFAGKGKVLEGVGTGVRQSRMEKRMQRMQREWREAEARRREAREELEEEREEQGDRDGDRMGGGRSSASKNKKGKKRRKRNGRGVDGSDDGDGDDEDPWAVVTANRKRGQAAKESGSTSGLVGLHDVVLAPPKFSKVPKKKMDVGEVVRKGGMKKQVELSEARKQVIEGYRQMMKDRRVAAAAH